eukprot:9572091-Ditylum_brightwellii.AAC.1
MTKVGILSLCRQRALSVLQQRRVQCHHLQERHDCACPKKHKAMNRFDFLCLSSSNSTPEKGAVVQIMTSLQAMTM